MKENTKLPLISIIMPVYNGEKFIEYAINSILNQTYKNFELIIIDGDSSDRTVEIINKYLIHISYFVSEKDKGMYNAINKGLMKANGDIICWLNSDDYYFPNTLDIVANTFNNHDEIQWLTGRKVIINENNSIIKIGVFKNFISSFIRDGYYRSDLFGTITQETTFWRKELLTKVGYLNEDLKVASDYQLWTRFAEHTELYSINSLLGAFRIHKGQLSEDKYKYYEECDKVKKIRFKKIKRLLGIFIYFYSMISNKNKLLINSENNIIKNKNDFVFE